MNYEDWEKTVPDTIKSDSLWKMSAYRLALFLSDVGWYDVTKLMQDRRTLALSDQLYRALGSISANLAEGYSRGTGNDRARFYEYGLGSARESRDWYYKSRHLLGEAIIQHRLQLLSEVIRLLLTMIPQQRKRTLREASVPYSADSGNTQPDVISWQDNLANLLHDVPLPEL